MEDSVSVDWNIINWSTLQYYEYKHIYTYIFSRVGVGTVPFLIENYIYFLDIFPIKLHLQYLQ